MLKTLQAATGVIFFSFLIVHLANTWLAALGPQAYNGMQGVVRQVYQYAPVEALLMAALLVHLVVGILRIVREPKRNLTIRARWHRYAGFFLAIVIFGHILAVRGPSLFFAVYPGFEGLAFSIDYAPAYFFPYYFLLATAGFYHGCNGLGIALSRLGAGFALNQRWLRLSTASAAALSLAALLGLAGVWTETGDVYDSDFARLAFEIFD